MAAHGRSISPADFIGDGEERAHKKHIGSEGTTPFSTEELRGRDHAGDGRGLHDTQHAILAPMVHVSTLPFRQLALEYGATLVYGEEIVAERIIGCQRQIRPLADGRHVVEFHQPSTHQLQLERMCAGRAVFATLPGEPVVFQVRGRARRKACFSAHSCTLTYTLIFKVRT